MVGYLTESKNESLLAFSNTSNGTRPISIPLYRTVLKIELVVTQTQQIIL